MILCERRHWRHIREIIERVLRLFVFKEKKTLTIIGNFLCLGKNILISKTKRMKHLLSLLSLMRKKCTVCWDISWHNRKTQAKYYLLLDNNRHITFKVLLYAPNTFASGLGVLALRDEKHISQNNQTFLELKP